MKDKLLKDIEILICKNNLKEALRLTKINYRKYRDICFLHQQLKILEKLKAFKGDLPYEDILTEFETEFEQLTVYFIYRHLIKAAEDYLTAEYLQFTFISVFMIAKGNARIERIKCEDIKNGR